MKIVSSLLINLFLFLLVGKIAFGQLNLPTTSEGIGMPSNQVTNSLASSSGLAVTTYLPIGVNFSNPASYSRFAAFNFDVGLLIDNTNYTQNSTGTSNNYSNVRFSSIHIGLPIVKNKIGFVIGLYPFSQLGYNLSYESAVDNSTSEDTVVNISKGIGGSYVLHTGIGINLHKNLSLGLNIGYLWGSANTEELKNLRSSNITSNYTNSFFNYDLFFGSLYTTFGGILTIPFVKSKVHVGGTASIPFTTSAKEDGYITSNTSTNGTNIVDTILKVNTQDIAMTMPTSFKLGISLINNTESRSVGLQYEQTNWSDFSVEDANTDRIYTRKNNWRLSLGVIFRPVTTLTSLNPTKGYLSYITYSIGTYYSKTRLRELNSGANVNEYGFSAGFLLPLKRQSYSTQYGSISLNFKYAVQGNRQDNTFYQDTFTIQLGFLLGDAWFLKRKFD